MSILQKLLQKVFPSKPAVFVKPSQVRVVSETTNQPLAKKTEHTGDQTVEVSDNTVEGSIVAALRKKTTVILTGRAGTGKTTMIRRIIDKGKFKHVIVAPTGIAALNAKGQTIHSFFGIPPHIVNLEDVTPTKRVRELVTRIDLLVIDEISMVRADLLDVIDRKLQVNRSSTQPFGGVPVLMVGDFLQLPPIANPEDAEMLEKKGYTVFYAFGAKVFERLTPMCVELEKVHRQNEAEFLDLLGKVRVGDDSTSVVDRFNAICHGPHKSSKIPVVLAATNAAASYYNDAGMAALAGPSYTFRGKVSGEFRAERYPAPDTLELKVGARVMMVKNDGEKRWVNGTLATVCKLDKGGVWVQLDGSKKELQVDSNTWETVKYEWSDRDRKVEQKVVGSYSQIPLKLAWAITIHKSQGLTLQDVRIDLGSGAFSPGQTYVALSRATTLRGLSFSTPLREQDLKVDRSLVDGVKSLL